MGTRCIIGTTENIEVDKYMTAVYCGHDGYPQYVGVCLFKDYDTLDKINKLLKGGPIMSLGPSLENTSFYDEGDTAEKYLIHTPEPDKFGFITDIEYRYIFDIKTNTWWICDFNNKLMILEDKLKEINGCLS